MSPRGLYIFTHEKSFGNAPAHELFERVRLSLNDGVTSPRRFTDYTVSVEDHLPEGVTLTRILG